MRKIYTFIIFLYLIKELYRNLKTKHHLDRKFSTSIIYFYMGRRICSEKYIWINFSIFSISLYFWFLYSFVFSNFYLRRTVVGPRPESLSDETSMDQRDSQVYCEERKLSWCDLIRIWIREIEGYYGKMSSHAQPRFVPTWWLKPQILSVMKPETSGLTKCLNDEWSPAKSAGK